VFATGKKELYRRHGRLIGDEVRALGFNTDFAPVLDLALPASRAVLTSRAVSPDPEQTVVYAREFLRGLQEARVLGCGKHFPGLGEASLDSHHHLPTIHKSWERLWAEDIHPYRALRREMPFVIVAHAALPAATGNGTPASLSPHWINDILRKQVGFRGLVASDDLEMAGALASGSVEQASVETLRAGGDIYLVCRDLDHVWGSYQAVLREAERDESFARRVMQVARRVHAFKKKVRTMLRFGPLPKASQLARLKKSMEQFAQEVRLASVDSTTPEAPMAKAAK
jgi:beta-N-acetylhexosaminidase